MLDLIKGLAVILVDGQGALLPGSQDAVYCFKTFDPSQCLGQIHPKLQTKAGVYITLKLGHGGDIGALGVTEFTQLFINGVCAITRRPGRTHVPGIIMDGAISGDVAWIIVGVEHITTRRVERLREVLKRDHTGVGIILTGGFIHFAIVFDFHLKTFVGRAVEQEARICAGEPTPLVITGEVFTTGNAIISGIGDVALII